MYFLDTLILYIYFLITNINNFRGDSDTLATMVTLLLTGV